MEVTSVESFKWPPKRGPLLHVLHMDDLYMYIHSGSSFYPIWHAFCPQSHYSEAYFTQQLLPSAQLGPSKPTAQSQVKPSGSLLQTAPLKHWFGLQLFMTKNSKNRNIATCEILFVKIKHCTTYQ